MCGVLEMPSLSYAQCVKIQSGTLTDVKGNPITVGYDKYGYNYQAHIFNGLYENYSRPPVVVTEGTENLVMKWSDDWLANVDCNSNSKLDRGLNPKTGTSTGISMGWVTNHFEGDYLGSDGELHHYTYFVKIIYDAGTACGSGASTCIWGLYTVIEEVQNDLFGEYGGRIKFVNKLTGPGLGN
jgi:hypothetical protein